MRFSSSASTEKKWLMSSLSRRTLRKTLWLEQWSIGQQLDSIFFLIFEKQHSWSSRKQAKMENIYTVHSLVRHLATTTNKGHDDKEKKQ